MCVRGDTRMRHEHRRGAPCVAGHRVDHPPQVVECFARCNGGGVYSPLAECLGQSMGSTLRCLPAVALDVIDAGAARFERIAQELAAALAAKDDGPLARELCK